VAAVVVAAISLVGLVLVEGLASWLLALGGMVVGDPLSERRHTHYDAELGWAHVPGLRLADAYGPGTPLTIDARGFRGTAEVTDRVPDGVVRVVCLGDSFTMGYGVGDADTWPARLERQAPGLQAVNMGQGGYGPDQEYLWYRRDARGIEHHALVLALITNDFDRLQSSAFLGVPKPVLGLDGERLVVARAPARRSSLASLVRRFRGGLAELRTVQLLSGGGVDGAPASGAEKDRALDVPAARRVFGAILTSLAGSSREAGRDFLVVFVPTYFECRAGRAGSWHALALEEARARAIAVVDLVPDFLSLPFGALAPLYLDEPFHHLSPAGNDLVARRVWQTLATMPTVGARRGVAAP